MGVRLWPETLAVAMKMNSLARAREAVRSICVLSSLANLDPARSETRHRLNEDRGDALKLSSHSLFGQGPSHYQRDREQPTLADLSPTHGMPCVTTTV